MKAVKVFLLLVFLGNLGWRIYGYRERFLTSFDPDYWQERYLRSQWVDPLSRQSIGDDGLYTHVGWEYVHGRDPTTLNAQMPPLGKYLIGLTEIVFGNENLFGLFSGLAALAAFYLVSRLVLGKSFWSFLPVLFFSLEPLFFNQLRAPFLDSLYLFFLFLTFLFFLKENFLLSSLFLGLFTATKSPFLSFFVAGSLFLTLLLARDKEKIKKWLLGLPASFLVYCLVYGRFFCLGGNVREFLGVQKWIASFYLGQGVKVQPGMAWSMLFLNQWPVWWQAGVEKVAGWNLAWPALTVLSLASWFFLKRKKKEKKGKDFVLPPEVQLSWIWIVAYLLFLTFVPVWPRYFLLLLPFGYLLGVYLFQSHWLENWAKKRFLGKIGGVKRETETGRK